MRHEPPAGPLAPRLALLLRVHAKAAFFEDDEVDEEVGEEARRRTGTAAHIISISREATCGGFLSKEKL